MPVTSANQKAITPQEAHTIAVEAYIYFYSLVSMEITRRVITNVPAGVKDGAGPMNAFHHMRKFPEADYREVVRPNFDTLYSSAWLDISKEPMIVSVPDTQGRYYLLPMLDMWSDVFAVPGWRTSGTSKADFAVVPRGWQGALPEGVARIEAPTNRFWIIARTQTNGPADYEAVHAVQAGYQITPLSAWGKTAPAVSGEFDPGIDMKTPPLDQVNSMPIDKYLELSAELLKLYPPHLTDWSQIERLKRIGLIAGQSFEFSKLDPAIQQALESVPADAIKIMQGKIPMLARVANGWQVNTDSAGVYGNFYLKRAIYAMVGLGANQPEDAVYPLLMADADGKPLLGEQKYAIHFAKDEIPPAGAFWSITMYDEAGFQVANALNRFAIGDRDALKYNADGSLDIYIQHESPGADKESNWLPSPAKGVLGVTMRLYAPKASVANGQWVPPPVKRVG